MKKIGVITLFFVCNMFGMVRVEIKKYEGESSRTSERIYNEIPTHTREVSWKTHSFDEYIVRTRWTILPTDLSNESEKIFFEIQVVDFSSGNEVVIFDPNLVVEWGKEDMISIDQDDNDSKSGWIFRVFASKD